ncbi:MAG TPA: TrkA family potassium uptake protein [Spirochaetia bacterium]|nr:TrkA family potassium uptake protein [Spirochaetales bacterium]HRY81722.1 TrkA family potassium uptake protein [Spirochaetia bacterium]HRZ87960.1 TrkA family potassium uptake protein [Spirochaetia bacterium]
MRRNRYVVVAGCGRLGSGIAARLSASGDSVVIIDREESAFAGLPPEFSGFRIEGDASRLSVLKAAKVDEADFLIAATGSDNVNLMAAQVAKRTFGVARVLARVYDPTKEKMYSGLGIVTVCPTSTAAEMFFRVMTEEPSGRGEASL